MPQVISEETIGQLRRTDTPTVCNVVEMCGLQPHTDGYMNESIKSMFPDLPPAVGFAVTYTVRTDVPLHNGDYMAQVCNILEQFAAVQGPPVMVIQCVDETPASALFGDLICGAFQTFGAAGLVCNGPGRDLDVVRKTDFPVFCTGINPAHGWPQIVDVNVPVKVGGARVLPGDLIHADGNGVTTIPIQVADVVARHCPAFTAAEKVQQDFFASADKPSIEDYAKARGESQRLAGDIAASIKRDVVALSAR
ncbi:MAG: RraA family protein [Phycisphaeraceae bacterium]|jgi:regulator of RNase E activity RraA|nr:RraA family protein [Phycisphaeraceae bacterium]MDP7348061.1 RraA family protein [Phycisphaeraceae bacterium]